MKIKLKMHIIWCLITGRYTESKISKAIFIDIPKCGYPSIRVELNDDDYH